MASGDVRRVSRKGRPNYAVEFKRSLAMKACEAGVSVARLALENRINANLLFKWRRQYRAGLFGEPLAKHVVSEAPALKPVALPKPVPASFQLLPVVESVSATDAVPARDRSAARGIEVVFACATVRVAADADPGLLRVVFDCLARRR